MSHTIASSAPASDTIAYEGTLQGVTYTDGQWSYEGRTYDTPAEVGDLCTSVGEALSEPDTSVVEGARKLVFGGAATYTAQALLAMATAYEQECDGGEGCDPVAAVLREAARRVAVIEALTM